MQQSLNPWITRPAPADGADMAAPEAHVPPAAVISEPLRGMVEPDAADRLGRRTVAGSAALWVTGAHGGSGESRIADLIGGARATGHCWPVLQGGAKPRVLLVCRADMRGLTAARGALTEWVSGAAPAVDLLGLAVLADAPGKTPKPLRDFAAIVGGGAPRLWTLPWVESWRHGDSRTLPPAREYQHFITDLAALATDITPGTTN
ncbi:hypothetical protein SAMN04487914_12367 [Arthrobacter sp. ok909]|uniref:DUF6668 family protein n=1 Tax=Arthrobacter sp. ok909 TaxID=1761746 RepID=UPI0008821228|nr:DUF6668 family protein [Arthrobacter sp. ok909]SDP65293.1 hypothetical protein SAMN04487914_12367 [Arthrobacter sp. ok909]